MMRDKLYAIVTGASNGLGKAMALELAKLKKNLILVSLPHEDLQSYGEQLQQQHNIAIAVYETDLCDPQKLIDFATWVNENFAVDILINNAGIGGSRKLTEAKAEEVLKIIQLNAGATALLTHQLLPNLLQQQKAYLLNISSMAALAPIGYKTVYPASKAFVSSFTKGLRYELKEQPIVVSLVHPGPMKTTPENSKRLDKQGALGRFIAATAEENAKKCINGLLKGKKDIILNPLSYWMMRLMPAFLKTKMVSNASRKEILERAHHEALQAEKNKTVKEWSA